jgi:hypothetical protein
LTLRRCRLDRASTPRRWTFAAAPVLSEPAAGEEVVGRLETLPAAMALEALARAPSRVLQGQQLLKEPSPEKP